MDLLEDRHKADCFLEVAASVRDYSRSADEGANLTHHGSREDVFVLEPPPLHSVFTHKAFNGDRLAAFLG
jgi:hypothetical protein